MNQQNTMAFPVGYPELLEQIGQAIFRKLISFHLEQQLAQTWAFHLTEAIRTEVGGVQQYIPRGTAYELSLRDKQIWRDFRGNNFHELAHKYKLTEMQVRNIVKRARARDTLARQPSLLDK